MLDFLLVTECGTFSRSFNFMVEIYNFLKDFSFWVSVRNFFNFNTIDTSRLILKTKDKTSSSSLGKKTDSTENKILDTKRLVRRADYNAKIIKIDSKIPSATCLASTSALNTSKDEIPNVNDLVNKQIMI